MDRETLKVMKCPKCRHEIQIQARGIDGKPDLPTRQGTLIQHSKGFIFCGYCKAVFREEEDHLRFQYTYRKEK